jgi:signal transduction histidine kinase
MMPKLTDKQLIEELNDRLREYEKYHQEQEILIEQLSAEKFKTNFLSNARNELINPVSSLLGFSKNLIEQSVPDEKLKTIAQDIHEELSSLDFQLRNIFAAAEIEAGEYVVEIVRTDIEALIQSTLALCEDIRIRKNIQVNLTDTSRSGATLFNTDPSKLQLILLNLFYNAIEFSNEGSEVRISYSTTGKAFNLCVRDFGIGISPSFKEKIFDRFTQLDNGTTKSHKGHGLGLAITKALIELLNGTIDLESKGGCIFNVVIPELDSQVSIDGIATDGNEFFFSEEKKF